MSPRELGESILGALSFSLGRTGFSGLMSATTAAYRGLAETAMQEIGEEVFRKHLARTIYPESRALVKAHQEMGHTVAIVSSATRYQAEPLARDMGIEHVLCTRLEVESGAFTGRVVRPTCYGPGKALAARDLAARCDLDLSQSYFYTDSYEDLPLLEIVGRPRPLNPGGRLAQTAKERGWPVRRFYSRGRPGFGDLLRTVLAVSAVVPSSWAGIAAGLVSGSRREGINVAGSLWGELATSLAGVDLRVEGEEHLWSQRPAVFIFNHQSGIDAVLMIKLLRRDVTGVGKKEPAVKALREGMSLVIAPEGTRSPTPRLGPFKKGAFHIAMQAGVPVVPIVFRNALDALPRGGLVVRPATIEAVVLPPVDTSRWQPENLGEEIAAIRAQYIDVLEGVA